MTHYGNATEDCNGARMRACSRQLATVVTVEGRVDASNSTRVSQYVTRFVLTEKPLVLDLSALDSISAQSISMIYALDDKCHAAGVEWELVANPAIIATLAGEIDVQTLPVAGSVAAALAHFADMTRRRRRLLPLMANSA